MLKAEELFARHHKDILRYLAHMTGRVEEAEDLAQEVFVRVIRALDRGQSIDHERGWLFSIARNLLLDRIRSERRIPSDQIDCDRMTGETQGLALDLRQSLEKLSVSDREMFLLREVGGFTYQEIADLCQCTVEGVRTRLYRARMALREILNPRTSFFKTG